MPTTNTPPNPPIWNTGFKIGPKKAFQAKEVWEIRFHLQNRGLVRDRALFDLAIDSKLRGCDLVKIRIGDIAAGGEIVSVRWWRSIGSGDVPGEQIFDAVDWVVCDASQHVAEVGFRIEAVHLRGLDQREVAGCALATSV